MAYVKVGVLSATLRATITVMANPGVTITAVGPRTYSRVADGDGVAVIPIRREGSYTVTSSVGALFTETVNVTERRNYTIDLYKATTQIITLSSTQNWLVPRGVRQLEVCCIGAGGGGGGGARQMGTNIYYGGGGGGGGGYKTVDTINVASGTSYLAAIGAGGIKSHSSTGASGGSTSFGTIVAQGGNGGEAYWTGGDGGAGGNNGGKGGRGIAYDEGGGTVTNGTNGSGDAVSYNSVYYSGGGGGGGGYAAYDGAMRYGSGGEGGNRGGGKGGGGTTDGSSWYHGVAGTPNTGGGGGGAEYYHSSANSGGSGVIILKLNP